MLSRVETRCASCGGITRPIASRGRCADVLISSEMVVRELRVDYLENEWSRSGGHPWFKETAGPINHDSLSPC
jgi:hypothetical protein